MFTRSKSNRDFYRLVFFAVGLPLIFIFLWFKKGLLFAGAEEGLSFYDLVRSRNLMSSIWYELGTGFPLTIFVPRIPFLNFLAFWIHLGLNEIFLQATVFWFLIATGTVSFYFLLREIFKNERVAFLGGLFYFLNPYSLTQVWGRSLLAPMFAFALLPLFFLLSFLGIKRKKFYFAFLAVLASFVLAPAFVMVTQIVVLWVPVSLYFLFQFLTIRKQKERLFLIVYFGTLFFTWVLVQAWWLWPTFGIGNEVFTVSANNLAENIGTLRGVSAHFTFKFVIRLMQNFYFFEAKTYGEIYSHPVFLLISWLVPAAALLSLGLIKKNKELKFFGLLFLFSLFVSLGASPPFGRIFVWFFVKSSFLQAFRNPYEKFGLVFLFAYTPFFALGLNRLPNLTRNIVLVLVCGLFVWPLWTGDFAGKNAFTRVPNYYQKADEWLNFQAGDGRIMQLPLISTDGVKYLWSNPYVGIEPSEFLFTRESIGRNVIVNKIYYNVLLQRFGNFSPNSFAPDPDISQSTFRSQNLAEELAKLNIRFLVFHNDLDEASIGGGVTKTDFKKYLANSEGIQKVATFGELEIYEVNLPEKTALIYSPEAQVNYQKISSTTYEVEVKNEKDSAEIYFLELFNSGWEARVDGQILSHGRIFDYANAWTLNQKGNFKILIDYKPQQLFEKGTRVSQITLVLILTYLVFVFGRKKMQST